MIMPRPHEEEPTLTCEVCMKEIPRSVAQSYEGPDYVMHFCGAECYAKWQANRRAQDRPDRRQTS